jgi:putative ABC transport system permease protein
MASLVQNLRFGARMLLKNPGFSLAAIVTLALGMGGNTAIFTITSALMFRPLPYASPQQLVALDTRDKAQNSRCCTLGWTDLIREHNQSFSGFAVAALDGFNLSGRGEPRQVAAGRVSPEFFEVLGVKPVLGRAFLPDEGQPAGKPVVMISNELWHSQFGADRNVVGQTVTLDSTAYTVVGVLPAGIHFPFLGPADVWTPRYFEHSLFTPQRLRQGVGYLGAVARLRPGVSREKALAEMQVLHQQYRKENPAAPDADPGIAPSVSNLQDSLVANLRLTLLLLSVAVGVVLLIACANVASLLLSRALARKREIAVRTALGAQRGALIFQLLTENVLLAFVGGALGLGVSWAATRYLASLSQNNLPQGIPVTMDARVLLFTLGLSVFTGLAFGIFPALQLSRTNVNETLRDEGRGSTGSHHRVQLRGALVAGQVALSLLLMISAGLLVRSFSRLLRVDPGFDPQNVLTMNVSLPTVKYADTQKQIAFFDDLLRRVSALPGVRSAAISAALPLNPIRITPILAEGQPEVPLGERPFTIIEAISPSWFRTMSVPLRTGRQFTDADNAEAPKVLIVNESLARRYWSHENAIGKHIALGRLAPSEVVGVVADVKNRGLAQDAQPQIYLPFPQLPWRNMNLLVRSAVAPRSLVSAVRGQIAAVDADQPVANILTVDDLMDGSRAKPRSIMLLLGLFSAVALVLAIVGIYGVLAYSVAQRRQELGIRLALGAEKSDIFRLVVGQGLTLTLIGISIGLVTALILSWAMSGLLSEHLYNVSARDLATFSLAPLAFLAIAVLASYLPARRATKVDPTEALR